MSAGRHDIVPRLVKGIDHSLRERSFVQINHVLLHMLQRRHPDNNSILAFKSRVVFHPAQRRFNHRQVVGLGCLVQNLDTLQVQSVPVALPEAKSMEKRSHGEMKRKHNFHSSVLGFSCIRPDLLLAKGGLRIKRREVEHSILVNSRHEKKNPFESQLNRVPFSYLGVIASSFQHIVFKLVLSREKSAAHGIVGIKGNVELLQAWQQLWDY